MRINRFPAVDTWHDVNVVVDDNGTITNEPVPGKIFPDRNCMSDYNKNNRRFRSDGELITEFCNLDTYTNYRVYSQNCKPFAYVQTDINATKCGYTVPLPEPFVPPTPWGVAPYGFYAYHNICDEKNVPINVRIYKRNYTGDPIKIQNSGASPVIISYKNTDDKKTTGIRSCELQLTFVSGPSFNLEQLYTSDEREFKVIVLKNDIVKFTGFGTPSDASEEFSATPYDVTWRATDGLGSLKKVDYPMPVAASTDIRQNFLEIICYALALTNLNLDIATIVNCYEAKMANGINDDPLKQATVNPLRFTNKGKVMNCYEVLEKVCLQFGALLVQDNGIWNFVREAELAWPVLRKRTYKYTGYLIRGEQFFNKRTATCKGDDISILDDNPTLRIGNAYKRAEALLDFGEIPFLLYNGGFEIYNGSNFAGWTKYGGIKVSQIEKQITTTTGKVGSGDFALQFDEIATNGKYLESSKVQVVRLDKITLSFNIGKTSDNNSLVVNQPTPQVPAPGGARPDRNNAAIPNNATSSVAFKLRIKVGEYYLTNPANDGNYQWVAQLAICTINVNNTTDSINAYLVKLDLPEAPINGDLNIQLFGISRATLGTYYPVYIDNIAIDKSTETKTTGQIIYVTQQDGFYTDKSDQLKLLFGDVQQVNAIQTQVRPVRSDTLLQIKNDGYAIYTVDGSYSTGWYEYGQSTQLVPLGIILTRSVLKAYQKPFRFLQSSFLGEDISYLDIFNVILPDDTEFGNRVFALLSGDFNLKTGEVNNANYAEIFSKPGKAVDIVLPGNSGDPSPPISQNPNPAPVTTERIFTEEFTQEFK